MDLIIGTDYVELNQDVMMSSYYVWRDCILVGVEKTVSRFVKSVLGQCEKQVTRKYSLTCIRTEALAFGGRLKITPLGVIKWACAKPMAEVAIATGVPVTVTNIFRTKGY